MEPEPLVVCFQVRYHPSWMACRAPTHCADPLGRHQAPILGLVSPVSSSMQGLPSLSTAKGIAFTRSALTRQRPAGCGQDHLPSLATQGPQPCGFSPREGEPADPLSLADDDFTNFAFSIAWYERTLAICSLVLWFACAACTALLGAKGSCGYICR